MTHDASIPEPAARRRRFPLTTLALVGSAIAVPLYLAYGTMESLDEPVATQIAEATVDAPELPAHAGSRAPVDTPTVDPMAPEPEPEPEPDASADFRGAKPTSTFAPAPASPPADKSLPKGESSAYGVGGLGLVGTGRGGGGTGEGTLGVRGDAKDGALTKRPAPRRAWEGDALRERDEAVWGSVGDDTRRDPTPRAGQLTAGAIDDLGDTKLLDELRGKVAAQDGRVLQAIPEHAAVGPKPGVTAAPRTLQIGFVLDTTGSMGDEIEYLKAEIRSIAEEIGRDYPNLDQRYALVAYKDHGDEYVVRGHGFESLDGFVARLGSEYAGGGGDFPEAMDEAMTFAAGLPWAQADAANLVFLVADAPPHDHGYTSYARATVALAGHGVSVYPVASSGVETVCEYLMRWAARATGGKYLFLTDHSGIGNAHATPVVDQYELKPLRAHMLDVIRDELSVRGAGSDHPTTSESVVIAYADSHQPSWMERHGLFVLALGGVFLLGFAGDMTMAAVRRRRPATLA
jgi:hypothetical protein